LAFKSPTLKNNPMNLQLNPLKIWLAGLTCLMFTAASLFAQPPGKGGGGGGGDSSSNGGGVIYFTYGPSWSTDLYQMNADGSGVTMLPVPTTGLGSPSFKLHAGKRWFIKENLYQNYESYTGVVSTDGDVVPLFLNEGLVQVRGDRQWTKDDRYISFPAQRLDTNVNSVTFNQWVDFGLYRVEIIYSEPEGYPLGTVGQPTFVFPSSAVYYNNQSVLQADIRSHSWADDGLRFVFSRYVSTHRLSVGDLSKAETTDIAVDPAGWFGGRVCWSPRSERVMFNYVDSKAKVMAMNIDGTGITEIASSTSTVTVYAGDWSPTGSHLTYKHQDGWGKDSRIIRATTTGGSKTRITTKALFGSGPTGPTVIGWR